MRVWLRSNVLVLAALVADFSLASAAEIPAAPGEASFAADIRPLVARYCLDCHSEKEQKGELDLERFASVDHVRKDLKPWALLIEQLEAGEMPPKDQPQPSEEERRRLIDWTRGFLDAEARARAGDPGRTPLRRLSNAEYDYTVRDLTGVDLRPTREFPADGAAGEGFTNAGEALAMSPAMMSKYLDAAKRIASHAVLLPDGFRFSPTNTRRDWTDENVARMRAFYRQFTAADDGRLPLEPYVAALVRRRDELLAGKTAFAAVADDEKLNAKYLAAVWRSLTDDSRPQSFPLERIRARWRTAAAGDAASNDAAAIVAEISAWQNALWNFVPIGSYRYGNTVRQVAKDPTIAETQTLKLALKPAPGQSDVVLYLVARELGSSGEPSFAVWRRPRFESNGQGALLLRDYREYGPKFEFDYAALFADTSRYLAAAVEAANDRSLSAEQWAEERDLDGMWLHRWIETLAVKPYENAPDSPFDVGRPVPTVALESLAEKAPPNEQHPAINGWKAKGADLPILLANASDAVENIPGRVSAHSVAVHPTPAQFVAAVWKSPIAGVVRVTGKVAHAHPACGNGVFWRVEKQSANQAAILAEGAIELGKAAALPQRRVEVAPGDLLYLAIDARDGNHVCDMTEIAFTVTEDAPPARIWDLSGDLADNVLLGNPHADRLGNAGVWIAMQGPSSARATSTAPAIPADSTLALWREAAGDPERKAEAGRLAERLQVLLTSPRPADEKQPDRVVYDYLASLEGPLLRGFDLARLKRRPSEELESGKPPTDRQPKEKSPTDRGDAPRYALDPSQFGSHPQGAAADGVNLVVPMNQVLELRLPAALFVEHALAVEGTLDPDAQGRIVQFQITAAPPAADAPLDFKSPLVGAPNGPAHQQLLAGLAEFRQIFPPFICYPHVIPLDEVVCLKTFHREDEPLIRLFSNDEQTRQIDRLWAEHRFITAFPVVENDYIPLFIGFVTQDQPKELLDYFESQRGPFRQRAEQFEREFEAAGPRQLEQLFDFAARAYRRPLAQPERDQLLALYQKLRDKQVSHADSFRNVLARVLMSPSFLLHLEQPPPGTQSRPVNDWELASRLSYFLWSSLPDDELRRLAASGRLHDSDVLAEQIQRMLKDDRVRALAIEFGAQWIHVRGFDELQEKNEKLFPEFDARLRAAMYEESILLFQDLFQRDGPVRQILDADHAYLNEALAKHYGIPGVEGPQWRRVEGVKQYGRGGILGLAAVQAKQSGASRTSPVLRGNWVVETLLGEKLPRPPPNVPQLPEAETGNEGLTMRQLVMRHVSDAACATCHQRIDPFGFALESYDPIGRLREKDLGGLPVDAKARLKDGTEFEGLDGLRDYLLTRKKDVFVRLFCRRLLGYALGRAVALSDQPLIDDMIAEANREDGRLSGLVLAIVRSPQFRTIRGGEYDDNDLVTP